MSEQLRESGKAKRGFASMAPERQRIIASKGGRAAQEKGVAYRWDSEQAIEAGRKGGKAIRSKKKTSGQ